MFHAQRRREERNAIVHIVVLRVRDVDVGMGRSSKRRYVSSESRRGSSFRPIQFDIRSRSNTRGPDGTSVDSKARRLRTCNREKRILRRKETPSFEMISFLFVFRLYVSWFLLPNLFSDLLQIQHLRKGMSYRGDVRRIDRYLSCDVG